MRLWVGFANTILIAGMIVGLGDLNDSVISVSPEMHQNDAIR